MRITLVSETYFPQVNGVSRALGRLVDYLTRQGDQVKLLQPRYRRPAEETGKQQSVVFPSIPLPFYKDIRLIFTTPGTVRRHIREGNPDCVHVVTEGPLGWTALRAAQRLKLPLVTSYHTNFCDYLQYYHFGWFERPAWAYLRHFHNQGSVTFCPSRSTREILEARFFDNVIVWGRGVECDRFHPGKRDQDLRRQLGVGDNDVMVLYVGRIAHEKNLDMLMDAFAQLNPSLNCKLVLVGDGPIRERLQNAAGERVVFTGYKHGEELATHYASADLFVFPSITETFGNVILEGMASGLAAVGFDAPGPRDIIQPGKTGLIAEQVTADSLASAMQHLVSDTAKLKEMGECARLHAEAQTWDSINSIVRETYRHVVQKSVPQTACECPQATDASTAIPRDTD